MRRDPIEAEIVNDGAGPAYYVEKRSPRKPNILLRVLDSDWRIRFVWALRIVFLVVVAYWQPGMAAAFVLGSLFGYGVGRDDALKGWKHPDGTPFT